MAQNLQRRVADLVPGIREGAARTEAERAVATEVLTALMDLDLFSPRLGSDPAGRREELLDAVDQIAAACGSTGGLVAHAGATAWLLDLFPAPALDALRAEGAADPLVSFSLEPGGRLEETDDGPRLNGRWTEVTGAAYAGWLVLAGRRDDGTSGLALVAASSLRLSPALDTIGLGATGALDVEAADVALPVEGWTPVPGESRAQALLPVGASAAMGMLGSARGALETHVAQVRDRIGRSHGGEEVRTGDLSPTMVGRAASMIDAAGLLLREGSGVDADALPQDPFEHQVYAVNRAVQATGLVFGSVRGHALTNDDPVARLWRDVRVGAQRAHTLIGRLRLLVV